MKLLKNSLLYLALILCGSIATSCGNDNSEPQPELKPLDTELTFVGTTVTYPENDPSSVFTSESSTYIFNLDATTMKATLSINKAKFLSGMPEFDMDFKDIAFDSAENNFTIILFACDALTPEIGGRPFPQFPISDLDATLLTTITQLSWVPIAVELNFICDYRGTPYHVNFKGTPVK